MNRVSKIIGKLEKQSAQLRRAGEKQVEKADRCVEKAHACYDRPDEVMAMVQKVVSYLYLVVKKYNAVAFRKAQDLTRQAGQRNELADRAFRVADRFDHLAE
jgi:hypothetical protein